MFWELDGESVLSAEIEPNAPRADKPFTARLRHSNIYGPRPDVQFELGVGNNDDWQALELVKETVDIEGEEIELASLNEAPFAEAPWVEVFETTLTLPAGSHPIAIRVIAPLVDACGTLAGWEVDVID